MNELKFEMFWNDIPVGKENAISYDKLCEKWECSPRKARAIMHELNSHDNGDNYILVRSSSNKGFYKTDDAATIRSYKRECLNKGKSVFAPVKKINRVLNANAEQFSFENNLRVIRESHLMKQNEVCERMQQIDRAFDKSMLSKMENGVCLPTPFQVAKLAEIYECDPNELITVNMFF